MIQLADRTKRVAESITLAVNSKAAALRRAGVDVVSFAAGEPDFDTPAFIKDAAKAALDRGQTKYTPTPCIPELRAAIARKFARENGLNYTPDQITTGAGGKFCLYLAMLALLNPGDEVIIPAPYWVSYPEQVKLIGATPVFVRGEESRQFKISPQQLADAITPRTRAFIVNSPSNPAGHTYSRDELLELARVMLDHPDIVILSDEIYEHLVYHGTRATSFATLDPALLDRTLTFGCHSKSFAMTGWRVGYVGGPRHIIDAMNKLQSQTTSHITSFTQMPAAVALDDPRGAESIEAMRQEFERRGEHMWKRLSELPGIACTKPTGAFYCFPNISAQSVVSPLLFASKSQTVPGSTSLDVTTTNFDSSLVADWKLISRSPRRSLITL
jgi:aspartate aminotransferase